MARAVPSGRRVHETTSTARLRGRASQLEPHDACVVALVAEWPSGRWMQTTNPKEPVPGGPIRSLGRATGDQAVGFEDAGGRAFLVLGRAALRSFAVEGASAGAASFGA